MNIVEKFQNACKNATRTDNMEDAGFGLVNVHVGNKIIQCYPNKEFHGVWVLEYNNEDGSHIDRNIDLFTDSEAEELYAQYCEAVGYCPKESGFQKTLAEYELLEDKIKRFARENGLTHEISCGWREIDFCMEYHEEAIDTKTLENPTCICTERHIVVWLPKVDDCPEYEERMHYVNTVSNLTHIATPNYIIGAKDGIVKAVMYCVWG